MVLIGTALRSWLQDGDGVSLVLVVAVALVALVAAAFASRWLLEHAERKPKAPSRRLEEAAA
jgi:hypothetical protein